MYLKLMLQAINDEGCLGRPDPLTMKSLDTLDTWTFRRILVYLIQQTQLINRPGLERDKYDVLVTRGWTPISPSAYDATVDHVYWALKELFPHYDDLITYQLLLFPSKEGNGKRVKAALNYLTSLIFFADQSSEAFENIHDEVQQEHRTRQELYDQIEDLKEKISERIILLEDHKEQVPSKLDKLRELTTANRRQELDVARLEAAVRESKKIYDGLDMERLRMERMLEDEIDERKRLETQIVRDPERVLKAERDEKLKLQRLLAEREAIGRKIQDVSRSSLFAETLITKTSATVHEIHDCIAGMEVVEKINDKAQRMKLDVQRNMKLVERLQDKLALLKRAKENARQRMLQRKQLKLQKKEELRRHLKHLKEEVQKLKEGVRQIQEKITELQELKLSLTKCNNEFQAQIDEHIQFLDVTVPDVMRMIEKETMETYEVLLNHCSGEGNII